jgi:hypothetical protein
MTQMKTSLKTKPLILGFTMLTSALAAADALPPPSALSQYTLKATGAMARVLYEGTNFQSVRRVVLHDSIFGQCEVEERAYTQENLPYRRKETIVCQAMASCRNHAPICTITVADYMGQGKDAFLSVLQEEHPLP